MWTVTEAISELDGWQEYFPLSRGVTDEISSVDVPEPDETTDAAAGDDLEVVPLGDDVSTVMPPRGDE